MCKKNGYIPERRRIEWRKNGLQKSFAKKKNYILMYINLLILFLSRLPETYIHMENGKYPYINKYRVFGVW